MECDDCKIDYPNGLVQQLVSSDGEAFICGVCALERINRVHGVTFAKFNGKTAERMRLGALEYRRQIGRQ